MNKKIQVSGLVTDGESGAMVIQRFNVQMTRDSRGKTLSISDGKVQFTVPFEPIERVMMGEQKQ